VGHRFVGREEEVRRILTDPRLFGGGRVTVLYGPRGCGKTALFEALEGSVNLRSHRVFVFLASEDTIRQTRFTFGPELDRGLVVDGVGAGGLRRARELLEHLTGMAAEYAGAGAWISIVAVAHAPAAERLAALVGGRVNWALMWNLPRGAAEDLAEHLGVVNKVSGELGVGREDAREILWRLAGGNTGALEAIAAMGVRRWLALEIHRAAEALGPLKPAEGFERIKGFWYAVEEAAGSPNLLAELPWLKVALLRAGVAIGVRVAERISQLPSEPWVGEWYAYQLPAYHHILREMGRRAGFRVRPEEILKELSGALARYRISKTYMV